MNTELKEVADELIGIDARRIWSSVRNLTLGPGTTIKRFCNGESDLLLSPGTYFFGAMALIYFLSSVSGFENHLHRQVHQQLYQHHALKNPDQEKVIAKVQEINSKIQIRTQHFIESDTALKFLAIPLLLFCRWFLFRKHINSFKANSWYTLFTIGHIALFSLPIAAFAVYITNDFMAIVLVLTVHLLYDTWASMQFYQISVSRSVILNSICFFVYISAIIVITVTIASILGTIR